MNWTKTSKFTRVAVSPSSSQKHSLFYYYELQLVTTSKRLGSIEVMFNKTKYSTLLTVTYSETTDTGKDST